MIVKGYKTKVEYLDVEVTPEEAFTAIRSWMLSKHGYGADCFLAPDNKVKFWDDYGNLVAQDENPSPEVIAMFNAISLMSTQININKSC